MKGQLAEGTETRCDNCGREPIDVIICGTRADGSKWDFMLCPDCLAKLPPIDRPSASELGHDFGQYTREELLDLLERSK